MRTDDPSPAIKGPPLLQLHDVSVNLGNQQQVHVLDGVSMHLREGEICAVMGRSGCGKTTLLNTIAGLVSHTKGRIEHTHGHPSIGYTFQSPLLLPWRTTLANCLLGIELQRRVEHADRERALAMLDRLGLHDRSSAYPVELSGGMQQRVAVARTLLAKPRLCLLDEPFSHSDFAMRRQLQAELHAELGPTDGAIIATHDIIEAARVADRLLILAGSPATVVREVVVEQSRTQRLNARHDGEPAIAQAVAQIWEAISET